MDKATRASTREDVRCNEEPDTRKVASLPLYDDDGVGGGGERITFGVLQDTLTQGEIAHD